MKVGGVSVRGDTTGHGTLAKGGTTTYVRQFHLFDVVDPGDSRLTLANEVVVPDAVAQQRHFCRFFMAYIRLRLYYVVCVWFGLVWGGRYSYGHLFTERGHASHARHPKTTDEFLSGRLWSAEPDSRPPSPNSSPQRCHSRRSSRYSLQAVVLFALF